MVAANQPSYRGTALEDEMERPLPHNLDAERSVLGAVLLDNHALNIAVEKLKPEDFVLHQHQRVFRQMITLAQAQQAIDLVTLSDQLCRSGELEAAGGAAYLAQLVDGVPRVTNLEHYARIVKDKAILRSLAHTGEAIKFAALEGGAEVDAVLAHAMNLLSGVDHHRVLGIRMGDVRTEQVHWLWPGRIPLGKLTMLDGDPGLGKSVLALDIAARVTRGMTMPDGTPGVSGDVLIFSGEDGLADTIRPRLEAAGADLQRIICIGPDEPPPTIPTALPRIEAAVRALSAALMIVDPFVAFVPSEINTWRDQDVRRALAPLCGMAERTGAAVVLIRHLNKMSGGNPIYRGGGSIGMIGAVRSGLLVARDPEEEAGRILACVKSNLAPTSSSLSFRLEQAESGAVRVVWRGECSRSASELLAQATTTDERRATDVAWEFLRNILGNGPVPAEVVLKEARKAVISEATLRRAKDALGIRARKEGFGVGSAWLWHLPDKSAKMLSESTKAINTEDLSAFEQSAETTGLDSKSSPKMLKTDRLSTFDGEASIFDPEFEL